MAAQRKAGGQAAGSQRGGFVVGLVVGLLAGLALALGVALYVTKVPVPFVDKVPQRTAEQDAVEAERNKRWDPNAPLAGKAAQRPPPAASPASGAAAPALPSASAPLPAAPAVAGASKPPRDPAAILAGAPTPAPATVAGAPASAPKSTTTAVDAFSYFVQVGAYSRSEDAEAQRAKLAMLGFTARVTEREQSGRTVYRVRLGPFERKDAADQTQDRLRESAIESALVRVER